jgi:uncharacterized protein YkwD
METKTKFIPYLLVGLLMAGTLSHAATTSDAAIQQDILKYINQYRTQHGLNTLKLDPVISQEATRHSQDMAAHRIPFGHQYFSLRIKRLYARIKDARAGAENVAFNYKNTKELVRLWTLSRGHQRNIVGHYNLTGIGVARDNNGKIYYTQMFLLADKKP